MRARDRLPDLRRRASLAPPPTTPPGSAAPGPEHPPHIAETLQEAERIQGWVSEVRRDTAAARALLADPTFHTDKRLQDRLDGIVTNCNAVGLKVCGALRQLEARATGAGAAGAAGRIARLHAAAARRAFADALGDHQLLLAAARDTQLRLLRHHAHIVNLTISDEECQSLLDTDNIALFVDNVRAETAEARLALREAEARHAELRRVEAALREVRALFLQLGALVAAQQDAIDSVQHFALQSENLVGEGHAQLLKGTVTRKRTRKKKLTLIACLASGFLVVLLVLIFT